VVTAPNLNSENFWFYTEFINADLSKVINTVAIMQKRIDQSISFEWLINPAKTSPKELF
jgi:ribonucleoside-diphosphate reductase alpha chain